MASHAITDRDANRVVEVNADNALKIFDYISNSLVSASYDYISMTYLSDNLTALIYKTGGAGGTTVSTLTLTYDLSNNLTSVAKV